MQRLTNCQCRSHQPESFPQPKSEAAQGAREAAVDVQMPLPAVLPTCLPARPGHKSHQFPGWEASGASRSRAPEPEPAVNPSHSCGLGVKSLLQRKESLWSVFWKKIKISSYVSKEAFNIFQSKSKNDQVTRCRSSHFSDLYHYMLYLCRRVSRLALYLKEKKKFYQFPKWHHKGIIWKKAKAKTNIFG